MSTTKPIGYVLTNDDLLKGELALDSTEQHGPYAGPAAPALTNRGDLIPFTVGRWDETPGTTTPTPQPLYLKLVNAGGLYVNAEWVWQYGTDPADQWRGMNDPHYWTNVEDGPVAMNRNTALVYSRAFNRVITFSANSTRTIFLKSQRSASSSVPETSWVTEDWPVPGGFANSFVPERTPSGSSYCPYSIAWENPDGTLRFMYTYTRAEAAATLGLAFVTWDIYGSSDGGDTWALIVEDIANKYLGGDRDARFFTGDVSGDWIRVCIWVQDPVLEGNPEGLITIVSSDKGATWKVLDEGLCDDSDKTLDTGAYNKYASAAVVGTGSGDGEFMRIRCADKGADTHLWYELASRDSSWAGIYSGSVALTAMPNWVSAPRTEPLAVCAARGASEIYQLMIGTTTALQHGGSTTVNVQGFNGSYSYRIPLDGLHRSAFARATPSASGYSYSGRWVSMGRATKDISSGQIDSGFQNMGMTAKTLYFMENSFKWIGDRYMMLANPRTRMGGSSVTGTQVVMYSQTYHKQPLRQAAPDDTIQASGSSDAFLYWMANGDLTYPQRQSNYWSVPWGAPQTTGTATADNDCPDLPWWEAAASAGASSTWRSHEWEMDCTDAAASYFNLSKDWTGVTGADGNIGLLSFVMKVDAASGAELPYGVGASGSVSRPAIGAYVAMYYSQGSGGTFGISVAATADELAVYNCLGTAAGDTLYHATGLDLTKWHEFRLSWGVGEWAGEPGAHYGLTDSPYTQLGYGEVGDQGPWTTTGLLTLDTTAGGTRSKLMIGLGVDGLAVTPPGGYQSMASKIYMREIVYARGSTNMALGSLGFSNPTKLRGVPCRPDERQVAQGVFAAWGGGGGFLGDQFTIPIRYEYGTDQLTNPSPASYWRDDNDNTQTTIVFDCTQLEPHGRFFHEGVALMGSNCREVGVGWSDDKTFATSVGFTMDATQHKMRIATITDDGVTMDKPIPWENHELVGKYVRWHAGPGFYAGSHATFKVRANTTDRLQFAGLTQPIASYHLAVGESLRIYDSQMLALCADNGVTPSDYQYMRLRFDPRNLYEGYHRLGTLVAGTTVPLSVPLDWSTEDDEAGNVDLVTNINGTRVAYVAGDARRTITGTLLGDASRYRDQFRAAVKYLGEYSGRPMVLCQDDQDPLGTMLYSRYTGSTKLKNVAWKYDKENERWIKVGDMGVSFEEEV